MSNALFYILVGLAGLFAIYAISMLIDIFPRRHTTISIPTIPDECDGYLLIKRDSQGAQGFVHFNSDFDLFKCEDGNYICLKIQVEEVID